MATCCRLLQRRFSQNFRGLFSAGVVFDPLDQNALAVVSGFHAKPFHQPHHRAVVAAPPLAKAGDRPSLLSVQDPEGFVSGAPLDQFNSLEEFCGWARTHGVISKVVAIRRQLYIGNVYNLSITEDASYCLRLGVVHNCKCYIESLSEREMKKYGLKETPEEEIPYNREIEGVDPKTGEEFKRPEGVDKGWDYAPGANRTTPLYDLIARKLPNLDPRLGAAMWDALKDAVAMEQQLKLWDLIDVAKTTQQAAGEALVVHAVAPATVQDLQQLGVTLQSADIWLRDRELINALRDAKAGRGADLPESVWRELPKFLAQATPYLDTQDAALVYAFNLPDGTGKVVVRVNYTDKLREGGQRVRMTTNFIRTAGIVDPTNLGPGTVYQPLKK